MFQVITAMLRIFHQNAANYDTSVRAAALDMLLKNQPTPQVLRNVLLAAAMDQTNFEFATYVYNSVIDAANNEAMVRYVFLVFDIW